MCKFANVSPLQRLKGAQLPRRLINCPKLTHLKVETRKKLTRMYEEGHTVDADNFMRKLGCLHCGALSHFLVACPELQFTSKDQRWELSDLYQGGNPKQAQKLVREWREATQPAPTAPAKPATGKAPAAPGPAVKPLAAAAVAADAKAVPRPPPPAVAARAAGPAPAVAAPQRPAAQIGAQQPRPQAQPAKQPPQPPAEDARSTAPSEGSSAVASRSGSFLDQLAPGITRQDSTASSSQTGKPHHLVILPHATWLYVHLSDHTRYVQTPERNFRITPLSFAAGLAFGSSFLAPEQASSQPVPDLPIYSLFPRPAPRDMSPRAPVLNPFPGMQNAHSLSQAPEQPSISQQQQHMSTGGPSQDPHAQQRSSMFMQSSSQPGPSQPMQPTGRWDLLQNGGPSGIPAAAALSVLGGAPSGSAAPLPLPSASLGMFNSGVLPSFLSATCKCQACGLLSNEVPCLLHKTSRGQYGCRSCKGSNQPHI